MFRNRRIISRETVVYTVMVLFCFVCICISGIVGRKVCSILRSTKFLELSFENTLLSTRWYKQYCNHTSYQTLIKYLEFLEKTFNVTSYGFIF